MVQMVQIHFAAKMYRTNMGIEGAAPGHKAALPLRVAYKTNVSFTLLTQTSSHLAFALFQQRLGTDESVLVEVLATRTNEEILELKRVFKEGLV